MKTPDPRPIGVILSFLLFLPSLACSSEGPGGVGGLTLKEAVSEALAQAPEMTLMRAREDEAGWRETESLAAFLPQIEAGAYHALDTGDPRTNIDLMGLDMPLTLSLPRNAAFVGVVLPLFDGFKNLNQHEAAESLHQAARLEREWAEFKMSASVRGAYYQALAAKRLASVADQNLATLSDHLDHVKASRKGGTATDYDVLRVEVQYDEARTQKINAWDNVEITRLRLARAMGVPGDRRELSDDLPVPEDPALVLARLRPGLAGRKDLKAVDLTADSARRAASADAAFWVPTIGVAGTYAWYNTQEEAISGVNYQDMYTVGVFAQWNLFDGGASLSRSGEADARRVQAEAAQKMKDEDISVDLGTAERRYGVGFELYKTAAADIQKSEESVRMAREGFQQGVRTVSEQLDAQSDLFRARANEVNARLMSAEALLGMELATGQNLSQVTGKEIPRTVTEDK
jgi:outer membrane protein TolC